MPLAAHKYHTSVTKATLSKNGSVVTKCTVCNSVKSATTIYSIKTVSLSSRSYTYNGKAQKPSVTVKDSKGKTVSTKYYSVVYDKGNKYSKDKKFKKGVKAVTLKNKTTSATVKKLSAKKKYYVRVCTYKKVGKTTYYSTWSSAKSVTTKK